MPHSWLRNLVLSWRAQAGLVLFVGMLLILLVVAIKPSIGAPPCPCNVFDAPTGQSEFDDGGSAAYELGFKFQADTDGFITGVRFYKQGAASGVHIGNLWSAGGDNLASATFTGETASGWQEVTFGSPVAVTADTTYIASYSITDGKYIATTNYFAAEHVNFPLRAPASADVGGNGVLAFSPGTFPSNSAGGANYWVDVSFISGDSVGPEIATVTPTNNATDVSPGVALTAEFDKLVNPSSLTTDTFVVEDSDGTPLAGTVSYDTDTLQASFLSSGGYETAETYTATLKGGASPSVENLDGVPMAADFSWSFTISDTNECPCSLKDNANPDDAVTSDDASGVELGVKVKPSTNGFITAVRFYKPIISTETTHTVNVWSASGGNLATEVSANETEYGWQEVRLSSPVAVAADELVIVSYFASDGVYLTTNATTGGGLTTDFTSGYLTAYASGSTENAATGSGNANGVFRSTTGGYPGSASLNSNYYWVDAVFSTSSTHDGSLAISQTIPQSESYGAEQDAPIRAVFNNPLDAGSVTTSTVRLFDSNNAQITGNVSYDADSRTVVFTPTGSLMAGGRYTARLSASIEDTYGDTLGSEQSWSFTVGSDLSSDPTTGPGGPILVVRDSGDPYSEYYAEILRTEGFNYFDVVDVGAINASLLEDYDAVVLSEAALSSSQAGTFASWVNAGGTLVAMRPDADLSSLLGLTGQGTTRTNQYLLIDTADAPGAGLVDETIQFHGTADNYTLNGASAIANLYSDSTTATTNPAVTIRNVGVNGGQAIAFTYDLAKSVIATHQGNQAWAGDDRDGDGPIRANDLFFGNDAGDPQPDWTDLDKFHIPYADEQQRLLANILTEYTRDRKPLPRFWYMPFDYTGALIMAGDDHDLTNDVGTERIINNWLNESDTNCSVENWECVRASHYVYNGSAFSNSRALQYHNLDFEIGDHVSNNELCANYSSTAELEGIYTTSLTAWRAKYASIPDQRTVRMHCYIWSDWISQPVVASANDMRFDLNYVAWPGSWFGNRAPVMNGSLMNMRITDEDGSLLDYYQGVTNLDNVAANSTAMAAILDNTVNANGFYGAIGTHYDMSDTYDRELFEAARSRDIPMISSEQWLTWLDGRNSSSFESLSGSAGRYTFVINAAEGANGLRSMMPTENNGGTITSIRRGNTTVTYDTRTVKGEEYAIFAATPGSYTVTYSNYTPPDPDPEPEPEPEPEKPGNGDSGEQEGTDGNGSGSGGTDQGGDSGSGDLEENGTPPASDNEEEEPLIPGTDLPVTGEPDDIRELDDSDNVAWLWYLLGLLVLAGFTWWLVASRRRRRGSDSSPTVIFRP